MKILFITFLKKSRVSVGMNVKILPQRILRRFTESLLLEALRICACLCLFIFLLNFSSSLSAASVINSVVKIYTVVNPYNYSMPWQRKGQMPTYGSGVIISGKRILTNAHVVSDSSFIRVRKVGDVKKYIAYVSFVDHNCDLAVLSVEDESFFNNTSALEIGNLVNVRDKVSVYGFPWGGDTLSVTEGIVSRIEHQPYAHSKVSFLACQIDAAINPGNSGGPVIKDNKIVGIAFQGGAGDNIGYMVPSTIIKHFLRDLDDGEYNGFPSLEIITENMENPHLRKKYNMAEEQTGILVVDVPFYSPCYNKLKKGDIILSLDGTTIGNDGTISFRRHERTSYKYIVEKKYLNDTIKLKILRDKKILTIPIHLTVRKNQFRLVPHMIYDKTPRYYIIAGFVFIPLTHNYLDEVVREYNPKITSLLDEYYNGKITQKRREVVIISRVLADKINVGYEDWSNRIITRINGKSISSLCDVVSAFKEAKGKFHIIEDNKGNIAVIDVEEAKRRNKIILKKYRINVPLGGEPCSF